MTENPVRYTESGTPYTGSGNSPDDEMKFDVRLPSADPADVAVGGLARITEDHAAAFRSAADLSANLSDELRQVVSEASSAITSTLGTAYNARGEANRFMNDVRMYPEGRKVLAGEAIKTATDKVAESLEKADTMLAVASALTFEDARPRVAPDAALTARADLQMITARHAGNAGRLIDAVRSLAQRSDSVGALVADPRYLGDWLSANGVDDEMREQAQTLVRNEVVQAAAKGSDPKRAAAAKTHLALIELRKARVAAAAFAGHILQG